MYLNNRLPLPVNSSPVMVVPKQTFRDQNDALRSVKISLIMTRFQPLQLIDGSLSKIYFIIIINDVLINEPAVWIYLEREEIKT